MNRSTTRNVVYGLLGLASMLVSSVGYLYAHKLLLPGEAAGAVIALWQIVVALMLLSLAGGIGERLLRPSGLDGLARFGVDAALGIVILGTSILVLGTVVGTSLLVFAAPMLAVLLLLYKDVAAWFKNLADLRATIHSTYDKAVAIGALFFVTAGLAYALTPPTEFDALVYHLAIPRAYLQQGHISYLPDTMFWGMPQLTEMLYLPAMRIAGVEAATVFSCLIGTAALLGLLGYMRSKFNDTAAWTTIAALLAGENLSRSLSTGYVDWMSMLFGTSALIALDHWLETRKRMLLMLAGIFCGAALGTKYSAGIMLIGCLFAVTLMQTRRPWKDTILNLFILGLTAAIVSSPWWIKNFIGTGNPFYPFFVPAGDMDRIRLDFYQKVPVWKNWQAVILLPWQATLWGIDGKEGFAASIGPILAGLSPLARIGWKSRTEEQKRTILLAGIITMSGLALWALASRISGLLIQTRLYFVFFPAWAILAGAGMDAAWNLRSVSIRFGRLIAVLTLLMFGLSVFSSGRTFIAVNPAGYVLRLQDEDSYLASNLGSYELAMETIQALPPDSRVLMLWETRGYYCQPTCDSDEIIDRWHRDANQYTTPKSIVQAWHNMGYTQLLIFRDGADFARKYYDPFEQTMHWTVLDSTLASLPVEKQINGGTYTLYKIP